MCFELTVTFSSYMKCRFLKKKKLKYIKIFHLRKSSTPKKKQSQEHSLYNTENIDRAIYNVYQKLYSVVQIVQ